MKQTQTLKIDGMHCTGCEESLTKALERLDSVEVVEASWEEGTVQMTFDPELVGADQIADAVADAGYDLMPEPGR